jgi:glyoxylase-like metal-dependent hydrolase (beta-lactamase superfamily II)
MITVKRFECRQGGGCCYVLSDETKECVIVDPGFNTPQEKQIVSGYIAENGLKPVKLLCTHWHYDHVMGNRFVTDKYKVKTYIHPKDRGLLKFTKAVCLAFGIRAEDPSTDTVDIVEGDVITFGNSRLKVIHTPGHTEGGVCFYSEQDGMCLTGDTLFAGSIGRTDFPGGDMEKMKASLKRLVTELPRACIIYPGHGERSTIAQESKTNPFLMI